VLRLILSEVLNGEEKEYYDKNKHQYDNTGSNKASLELLGEISVLKDEIWIETGRDRNSGADKADKVK
jgi:hypothetical protein